MKITIDSADACSYIIFVDNVYLDFCIEADDEANYAIVYDSTENTFVNGYLFKKPDDICWYKKVYGNISIIRRISSSGRAYPSYG